MSKGRAIQRDGIQEDGHRDVERDAGLLRVGGSLPRISVEPRNVLNDAHASAEDGTFDASAGTREAARAR
jgi:hypothetical protein